LPYEEERALKDILAHHGVTERAVIEDVAALVKWAHQYEQHKAWRSNPAPPPLLSLLSTLGIYGKEVLSPPVGEKT
jgi:hypothetical protein